MRHYKIKHFDGTANIIIHLDGIFQPGDVAFCGHDLIGDSSGWKTGVLTKESVTCTACIRIVEAAKKVRSSEYKSIK